MEISGEAGRCPLCQGDLLGTVVEAVFPALDTKPPDSRRFLNVMGFITIAIAIISVMTNLSTPHTRWWSLFVLAGLASFWMSFSMIVRKRANVHKTIMYQVVILSGIAILWDVFTGFLGWSIDYVVPLVCTCAMGAMAIISKIMKLQISDYLVYFLIDSVLGVVSLVLLLCGVLHVVYPSAICVTASALSLAGLFFFEGRELRAEINRRLHL